MKNITLFGAGGHCHAVIELIKSLEEYQPIQVVDTSPKEESVLGVPVLNRAPENINNACITIGDNTIRRRIASEIASDFPSFVHPSVHTYPSVTIGNGTVVLPRVLLDASVVIKDFCIINNQAILSHHVAVHDYAHIAIGAVLAGGVSVSEGALIGAGSIINPNLNIGKWSIVGSGAVVTKEVPDFAVVVGNPAKIIRYTHER